MKRVVMTRTIAAPHKAVFDWFLKSENYVKSPIVFRSVSDGDGGETLVTWTIDIDAGMGTAFAGFMAKRLYGTIMDAAKRELGRG